jgi:molybdenum cofactor biosynthesis protein B
MAMANELNMAVLTVSDTRTFENDTSGKYLSDELQAAGHKLSAREIVIDDKYQMRALASMWIADESIDVILVTGGTGYTDRDITPEAMVPLFDIAIPGFGELFRQLSYDDIGTATVQSRAVGGIANNTLVFCMPGSTGACATAWEGILKEQLNIEFRPCNFAELIKKGFHAHG